MDNALGDFLRELSATFSIRHDPVETLQLFVLGMARWAPVFALTPFLGGKLVPNTIKLSLSVSMALWLLPGLSARAPSPLQISEVTWWALLIKEVILGFALAFSASLVFWAAEMGGRFIDNVRGTTTANILLPQVQVQSSLLGSFYFQLFVVLFLIGGGHLWFLGAVFRSYEVFPPLELAMATGDFAEGLIVGVGGLFSVMLRIIAPPLVCLMLLDLMLGVTNRMAPQLDVFFISLSIKATLGALMVALSLYYLGGLFDELVIDHLTWFHETTGIEVPP
jgi:flagellar biosynthetic protein FliR